jgi:hypothetical protein
MGFLLAGTGQNSEKRGRGRRGARGDEFEPAETERSRSHRPRGGSGSPDWRSRPTSARRSPSSTGAEHLAPTPGPEPRADFGALTLGKCQSRSALSIAPPRGTSGTSGLRPVAERHAMAARLHAPFLGGKMKKIGQPPGAMLNETPLTFRPTERRGRPGCSRVRGSAQPAGSRLPSAGRSSTGSHGRDLNSGI